MSLKHTYVSRATRVTSRLLYLHEILGIVELTVRPLASVLHTTCSSSILALQIHNPQAIKLPLLSPNMRIVALLFPALRLLRLLVGRQIRYHMRLTRRALKVGNFLLILDRRPRSQPTNPIRIKSTINGSAEDRVVGEKLNAPIPGPPRSSSILASSSSSSLYNQLSSRSRLPSRRDSEFRDIMSLLSAAGRIAGGINHSTAVG
jgi:hypothetical protein